MPQIQALDQKDAIDLRLDIMSFAGGENTIGQDQELKSNEARVIENWDSDSLGGMIRSKGFTKIADGGSSYSAAPDLLLHHFEGTSIRNYAVINGDVVRINGASLTLTDSAKFTPGVLCHGLSAGSKAWITNSTDNLKYTTIAGSVTVPSSRPSSARDRIYLHLSRLIAEGGGVTVFGARAGAGNWTAGNAWSLSGDAWNIDLPDLTQGCVPGWPSGPELSVFTKFGCYSLYNMPNVAFRYIIGSHGCCQPESIALGAEGVYFFSNFPTLGVYLWDGSNWTNLTVNETWVNQVSLTNRCFGIFSENKFRFTYNEIGSGVSYPNKTRIYDARWGRWMDRVINPDVADSFGYPALLTKSNNELYVASSQTDNIYQLEDMSNSDNGFITKANYKTKDFTSIDFGLPMDEITLKLIKVIITYYGSTEEFSLQWTADRGLHSGQMVFSITADGDILDETFILDESYLSVSPPDRTVVRKFNNSSVGKRFDFQVLNNAMGDRTKIKKVEILAVAVGETQNMTFETPSSGVNTTSKTLVHPDDQAVLIETGQTIETE